MKLFSLTGLFLIIIFNCSCDKNKRLTSPDGQIKVNVFSTAQDQLTYCVLYNSDTIINHSDLGIEVNGDVLGGKTEIAQITKSSHRNTDYLINKKKEVENHYKRYEINCKQNGQDFQIIFRIYNDGVAYRYILDKKGKNQVNGEHSSWKLPKKSKVWFFERPNDWKLKSYAGLWKQTTIDSLPYISPTGPIQGKPLLFELPFQKYAMVTEAALYEYSGMRLKALENNVIKANFTEKEGFAIRGEIVTPWRVTIITENLNELVNTDIIHNLNPEPDKDLFGQTEYIKPGKSVWSWLTTRGDGYLEIPHEKRFIDNASKLNFEYTLIDAGWEKQWSDKWDTLEKMCDYAKNKDIGVWIWKHSGEIMDSTNNYEKMRLFLDSINNAGAVGIKVDYMNGETKKIIDFEINLLKKAARRELMVNFHGCHAATGESKTYPNEMTREGIRGMELNFMGKPIPACHNAALPFTRFILGHGDYTPLVFSKPGNTTWGHQLATAYIFDSPFFCMGENPGFILSNKEFKPISPLLKELPVTWDKTVVLPISQIGQLAALARKKDNVWYVAIVNGENKNKDLTVRTDFLSDTFGKAAIFNDHKSTNNRFQVRKISFKPDEPVKLNVLKNGGCVIKIESRK